MKTYHIITIGCQMNKSDSERIANYLENLGYTWAANKNNASVVITTTCGVRQSAEDRVYGLIPDIKKANPSCKVVLTGCLSDRPDVQKRLKEEVDVWLPITQLETLAEKLGEAKLPDGSLGGYLRIQPKYESTFSAFVPIGNGCNNFCTYCVVPYARGRETYRDAEEIINEVKGLLEKGYKEITLIAQNVNSYKSGEINFPKLLKMVHDIQGNFWLRFSTSHPKDMSDELIDVIAEAKKVCRHIHLPVQSGDNRILEIMNRKYTREHYLNLIGRIKNKIVPTSSEWESKLSITTDIIVGFPGETEEQFNNTAKLCEEVGFDMAYIGQYSPRFGTPASKMEDNVSREDKRNREEEVMKIIRKASLANNKTYIGHVVEILVDQKKGEYYYGKTTTGKKVRVKSKQDLIGRIVKVRIDTVENFGMEGEIAE